MDEELALVFAIVTLPVGILTGLFVGLTAAVAVFVVGWFLLTPVTMVLAEGSDDDEETASEDPLDRLRRRYADGEIGDAEFERQLETLLETEDVDPTAELEIEATIDRLDTDRPVERE